MSSREERISRRKLRSSYITTIVSMTLVLFMLGMVGLMLLNAKNLSDYVKENIGFSITMKDGVKEGSIIRLQKELDRQLYVKSTEYITKEGAAKILTEDLGEDFMGFLGYNPLQPSIEVRLNAKYATSEKMAELSEELMKKSPDIEKIEYEESLVRAINENVNRISIVIFGFSILLMIIAFALINNTIRLSVYSRRFIIRSMQLVGATEGVISRPFILAGMLHGFLGALLAIALLVLMMFGLFKEVPELVNLQQLDIFISLFVSVIVVGVALSGISYYFAVRKYLYIKTENLYY